MPFYHFYGEFGDEDDDGIESAPTGGFEYEDGSAQFKADKLDGVPALTLKLLLSIGVAEMRVCYDGGSDEGFAHADDMWIDGNRKFLDDIIDALNTPASVDAIQAAATAPKASYWHNAPEHYRKDEPRQAISDALDELAHEVASQLLGSGYGTGEYELYGAVIVVFETGEMMDDPQAQRPLDRM